MAARLGRGRGDVQLRSQLDERQQHAAQAVDHRAVHVLDALVAIADADYLDNTLLRDRVPLALAADDQRRDDGERERNCDRERAPLPGDRIDVDRATDAFDICPHDVHADAATGDARHRRGRREPGREDEVRDRPVVHSVELRDCREAVFDRLLAYAFEVDAGAVVGDLNDDAAVLVAGTQTQRSLRRLAGRYAGLG